MNPLVLSEIAQFGWLTLAGAALGLGFFLGLWWTIRHGTRANHPALWFIGSFVLRTGLVLAGFYYLADGQWQRLIAALVGFVIVRIILLRTAPSPTEQHNATEF